MKKTTINSIVWPFILFSMSMLMTACGGGGGDDSGSAGGEQTNQELSLNHACFVRNSNSYQYGYKSISNIMISGEPNDMDWSRWAMLHDGTTYRLYFFRTGSNT